MAAAGRPVVVAGLAVALAMLGAASPAASQVAALPAPLRTFAVEKTPAERAARVDGSGRQALPDAVLPAGRDRFRSTVGLGYVQGADWGLDLQSAGTLAGFEVRADALLTNGLAGFTVERGSVVVGDADAGWRAEAGDLFSSLYGAARGARLSWGPRSWRHGVAVYAPRYRTSHQTVVGTYRAQARVADRLDVDTEVATSGAVMVSSGATLSRLSVEGSWRRIGGAADITDRGLWASVAIGRGVSVGGGLVRSEAGGESSDWRVVSVRLPVTRWLDVGLERTFSSGPGVEASSTAVMADVDAGRLRYFQRAEWGESVLLPDDEPLAIARQQIQSMTTYTAGPRLRLSLQLATAWDDRGRRQQWEEVETVFMATRTTQVMVAAPVPDLGHADRFRARLVQQLPGRFGLVADYGRLAPYQSGRTGLDDPRVRVMVTRAFDLETRARGGEVSGRVLDHAGQPVAGVRVKLGRYATNTDVTGRYEFRSLPAAEYDLSLDERYLPANFAWDGRRVSMAVTRTSRRVVDVLVAPLNVVHGRVYADRNGNGRYDDGEGAAGVVVRLGERVIATDERGAYSFYNLWPGPYVVTIDVERLPRELAMSGATSREIDLGDDRPATGVDFLVTPRTKPTIWNGGKGGKR